MGKLAELLEKHFGFKNVRLKNLESIESVTYQVSTTQGQKYIFKQDRAEAGIYDLLDGENQVLQKLSRRAPQSCPIPMKSLKGETILRIEGGKQLGRLLTFVEGEFLAEVEHSTKLFHSLGRFPPRRLRMF